MRKALGALVIALLAASPGSAAVPNPTVVGPIPNSQGIKGHPLWDSWFELGPLGYREAEYFVSGTARQLGSETTARTPTRTHPTAPTASRKPCRTRV